MNITPSSHAMARMSAAPNRAAPSAAGARAARSHSRSETGPHGRAALFYGLMHRHVFVARTLHWPALHARQTPQSLHLLHRPHVEAGHRVWRVGVVFGVVGVVWFSFGVVCLLSR